MAKFEIELRGLLNDGERKRLEDFLKKNGKLIKSYKRTQWIFGLSHEKKIDLRIKETNGEYEFSLKVGKLGERNRQEIYLPIPGEKIDQAFDFVKHLGRKRGVKAVRNADIYEYKGKEWAIVEVPNHSYYFEAEKLVDNQADGLKAEEEIKHVADELGLAISSPEEVVAYIKVLDKESNKIFDLSKGWNI